MKTWKILDDDADKFTCTLEDLELRCDCGRWAFLKTNGRSGNMIIAVLGRAIVFDTPDYVPPEDWLPEEIQCRHCGRIYGPSNEEGEDVR